jgi:predicted nucleotidyltransferase
MEIFDEKKSQIMREIAINHGLDLVILFGSQAKNKAIEESDIDIGVFRKKGELTLNDQTILSGKFAELFKNNNVDISIISPNNPVLMYNILKNGKVLYSAENRLADKLRLYSWKLLAESKSFRDHSFSILKNRIASFY